MIKTRVEKRTARRRRIKARIRGTAERPRLAVFRSNKHISLQLINDDLGVTLAAANDLALKSKKGGPELVGTELAKQAVAKGIKKAVFDRGGYQYTGVIKKLADAARAGGLEF